MKFDFRFNISYGKVEANDSEVMNSAMAAEIHDRIMKFPDLYDTQVCLVEFHRSFLLQCLVNRNIDNILGWRKRIET